MDNYKLGFWVLLICFPILMTVIELFAWKRGFKKGHKIGVLEERRKNIQN